MTILLEDSPLHSGHAGRGIGTYTRQLLTHLSRLHSLTLVAGSWRESAKTADLVHFPYFDLFSATLPSLRQPIVVTIHDVIPLELKEHYPAGKRGTFNLWRQKRALRHVSHVVTDSEYSKNSIHAQLGVPLETITVVPLAPDPELHAPDLEKQEKIRKKYDLPDKYVLYVGDINYNKNIPQLIKAMKFVDESIHVVLVGRNFRAQSIPEWRAIETQMAMSDVTDRVHFLPDIATGDTAALASIYAQSLCYVQPSLAEGFGLPVLDALQVGTPVIASNRASLPEVGGAVTHYVEPTAEAMAEAIMQVQACSLEKRQAVISAGQEHARTFSWRKTAQETFDVYHSVLNKS